MTVPKIAAEADGWALIQKPHGMPSAPLTENEEGTLLEWFLGQRPEARTVSGKKAVEHGLLHRLDTGTEGLVLIAKTQPAFNALSAAQQAGLIKKTYFALCSCPADATPEPLAPGQRNPGQIILPLTVRSRFRSFGPKGREVRPLFPGMRGYEEADREYETVIETIENYSQDTLTAITCTLVRGYRHQVRAHLAWLGFPIIGDRLYSSESTNSSTMPELPLQLYAVAISFPDPESARPVSFSLPLPDKMIP